MQPFNKTLTTSANEAPLAIEIPQGLLKDDADPSPFVDPADPLPAIVATLPVKTLTRRTSEYVKSA